jgi:DNA invertase Pin-like site-specific DNA recombinase
MIAARTIFSRHASRYDREVNYLCRPELVGIFARAPATTTSMGRLTLNVLLSFAQFEREVAGERIRDKIAASPNPR